MPDLLIDTSVLIAAGSGRPLAPLPDGRWSMPVVTLAELQVGVLRAPSPTKRQRRLATLMSAQREIDSIPVDEAVATTYAELCAWAWERSGRPAIADALIAATAATHGATLVTQDTGFAAFDDLDVFLV